MSTGRTIVAFLLMLALATASFGMTRPRMHHTAGGHAAHSDAVAPMSHTMESEQADCAPSAMSATDEDCPACNKDKSCSPAFCLAKCLQFVGALQRLETELEFVVVRFGVAEHAKPPDWSHRPQPPPPRT